MATAHAVPAIATAPARAMATGSAAPEAADGTSEAGETVNALVPVTAEHAADESAFPALVLRLPVNLDVRVPVRDFRMRQLLALAPGQVIETQWNHGEDLPLAAGDVEVAWSEFEVVEAKLAVRITRLE